MKLTRYRQLVQATILATVVPLNLYATEMKPLLDIAKVEQSLHGLGYINSRCAGLMMEMSHRASRSGGQTEELTRLFKNGYEYFTYQAATMRSMSLGRAEGQIGESITDVLEVINDIQRLYFDEMESHYRLTGDSLSAQAQSEVEFCAGYLKSSIASEAES